MNDDKCPLETVDRRLNDAHRLLHAAQESYFDPDDFRARLNDLIQALRNVTFILQSNKSRIPNFDGWYSKWQQAMRADPLLLWAHDARTQVVKRGDLETFSKARIAIVDSYFTPRSQDLDVPPWSSPEEIAAAVAKKLEPPETAREIATVRVERRWVDSNLPNHELLDVLHYVLMCLRDLVDSAHAQIEGPNDPANVDVQFPGYVEASEDVRTAYLRLKDLRFVTPSTINRNVGEINKEMLEERYGAEALKLTPGSTFTQLAHSAFRMARNVIERDGYHRHFAIIVGPAGVHIAEIAAEDKGDKLLIWARIAKQMRERGDTSIIVVGEAWEAYVRDKTATVSDVSQLPDKEEGLSLTAASKDGDFIDLYAQIRRDGKGSITLGETQDRSSYRGAEQGFLAPIYEIWR